jgi:hypothetical protein
MDFFMAFSHTMKSILSNPIISGMLIGFALFLYARALLKSRQLSKEVKKLREHLHTKLEIESSDNERRKAETEKLKQERDNLRNTVQVLSQKSGRQELRQAQILQKTAEIMFEKSPGFAPAWQATIKEAEEEMRSAEKGLIPFIKRMTGSASKPLDNSTSRKKTLELEDPEN